MNKVFNKVLNLINTCNDDILENELSNYHAADIADVLETLSPEERRKVYDKLSTSFIAEIMSYYENVENYVDEFTHEETAEIIEELDSDEAIAILNELTQEDKEEIIELLDKDIKEHVLKIDEYDEKYVGAYMSDNFIMIKDSDNIQVAMKSMISQASEHDNIFTLFVINEKSEYLGVVYLKDLIIARKEDDFKKLIKTSYPAFYDNQIMSECIGKMKDYGENIFPVLGNNNQLLGVITIDSIVDIVEEDFIEDYTMLGGLPSTEEFDESIKSSVLKRIPWLIILLFLSFIVSSVIGTFEDVIDELPVIVFFQSMILGMAGNVGTQSLAVTIRNLTDNNFAFNNKKRRKSIWKELRIGILNGLIVGVLSFVLVFTYLNIVKLDAGNTFDGSLMIATITSVSMIVSISMASLIGSLFPLLLTKMKIDPAVASGPFITTMNDILSVLIYYGLTWLLFFAIL